MSFTEFNLIQESSPDDDTKEALKPRRSKKIQEDPRRSKKIQEDPRRSKKIQKVFVDRFDRPH